MQLLNDWHQSLQAHDTLQKAYITGNRDTARSYAKAHLNKSEVGFNVFTISSDIYYRENFHSDIIKALLDPNEKHQEGDKFLQLFIQLLNQNRTERYINSADFSQAEVHREKNNIDILITDAISEKAILIENKIYNAVDQQRQLPRYFEIVSKEFEIESIVYLTLNASKYINRNGWTIEENQLINPLLYFLPSYSTSTANLYDNWICPSIIGSSNADSLFLLRQYGQLIKFLNTNAMDTISLEKFYNTLKESDNLKTSLSIRNMLNDLPEYLAIRIEERYKNHCHPFKNVWRHQRRDTVFEAFELENLYLKMDIWCSEHGYKVHFWNSKDPDYDIKENLAAISALSDFNYEGTNKYNVEKFFNFDEETHLFEFIDNLLKELKAFSIKPISENA